MLDGTPFKAHGECTFTKGGAPSNGIARFVGIISSESRDADGETVLQNGLKFDYFLKSGWFNDNHGQETGAGVGIPVRCEVVRLPSGVLATRAEGYLIDTPRAREILDLALASQTTGRKLGFSIEGAITQRIGPDGKIVAEAHVRDVAIARHPKNMDTATLDVVIKSLTAASLSKSATMTAGYGGPAGAPGTGAAYTPQSLDGARPTASSATEPELSEPDAIRRIMRRLNCSEPQARKVLATMRRTKEGSHARLAG